MKVRKINKDNHIKINAHLPGDEVGLISKLIKIVTVITDSKELTDKEFDWFVCFILVHHKADLAFVTSPEAIQIYETYFKREVKLKAIWNYFNLIRKKGWIYKNGKDTKPVLPPCFTSLNLEKDQMVDFEIRMTTNINKDVTE